MYTVILDGLFISTFVATLHVLCLHNIYAHFTQFGTINSVFLCWFPLCYYYMGIKWTKEKEVYLLFLVRWWGIQGISSGPFVWLHWLSPSLAVHNKGLTQQPACLLCSADTHHECQDIPRLVVTGTALVGKGLAKHSWLINECHIKWGWGSVQLHPQLSSAEKIRTSL